MKIKKKAEGLLLRLLLFEVDLRHHSKFGPLSLIAAEWEGRGTNITASRFTYVILCQTSILKTKLCEVFRKRQTLRKLVIWAGPARSKAKYERTFVDTEWSVHQCPSFSAWWSKKE